MNDIRVIVISFASILIILAAISELILYVNAQGNLLRNNSSLGSDTISIANRSSIITPWNTGNERNSSSVSTTR